MVEFLNCKFSLHKWGCWLDSRKASSMNKDKHLQSKSVSANNNLSTTKCTNKKTTLLCLTDKHIKQPKHKILIMKPTASNGW